MTTRKLSEVRTRNYVDLDRLLAAARANGDSEELIQAIELIAEWAGSRVVPIFPDQGFPAGRYVDDRPR